MSCITFSYTFGTFSLFGLYHSSTLGTLFYTFHKPANTQSNSFCLSLFFSMHNFRTIIASLVLFPGIEPFCCFKKWFLSNLETNTGTNKLASTMCRYSLSQVIKLKVSRWIWTGQINFETR